MQRSAPRRFRSYRRAVAAVAAALVVVGPMALQGARIPAVAQAAPPPNIVLLLTDDQRPSQLPGMTNVGSLIQNRGVTFDRGIVPDPLCCPSRFSILRGQVSQRHGLWANAGKSGGLAQVKKLGLESSTVATWLQTAGYRTALVGKYVNGYDSAGASYVPPGWDYWRGSTRSEILPGGGYFSYGISEQGVERLYGTAPADYSTPVLTKYAHDFITTTPADQPLFLYLSYRAPHTPSTPEPKYANDPRCATVQTSGNTAFNEADMSDAPDFLAKLPVLNATQVKQAGTGRPRKTCRSLLSVDDSVARVIADLTATGRLSNTLIVYTSDNGVLFGEHRWQGKKLPYVEVNHVPFVIRYDPITASRSGTVNHALVENLDLASTWAQVAGVLPPIPQDGMSLIPLLDGSASSVRSEALLQAYDYPGTAAFVPGYCGLETDDGWVYVHYDAAAEPRNEVLYDLNTDPAEVHNLAYDPTHAARKATLLARLRVLCNPGPPGFSW